MKNFIIIIGITNSAFFTMFGVSDDETISEFGFASVFGWVSGETRLTDEIVRGDKVTFFNIFYHLLRVESIIR